MKAITALVFTMSLLASGLSGAAALELHVKKSVTIAAPADKVWDAVKNFNELNTWHPALASDEIVSGTNNVPGAVRLLTLKGGGTIKEKLLQFDAAGHRFRYSIIEGVIPVTHYTSSLVVTSLGSDKTLVTWTGRFKRKNVGDMPADNENDAAATDAISGVYQSGLDNLKKMFAAQ
ncbi:MAG: SRPBCC family protein [Steroidobacteraceae bacterium]|jgi:mxaD protein